MSVLENEVATLPHHHRMDTWKPGVKVDLVRRPEIRLPMNPERRTGCRENLLRFCEVYFAHAFRDPNDFHVTFLRTLQVAILSRSSGVWKKALAAPRGIGKTTCVVLAILWAAVYRHRNFMLVICANAPNASDRIATVKDELLANEMLADDFPEIVGWVRSFGGDARRAASVGGEWSKDTVHLNNGVWIATLGIDGSIAGALKQNQRPDFVVMDDLESEASVKSDSETRAINDRVRKEICFLHGAGQPGVYLMICTVRAKDCNADRFTDPDREPQWKGQRFRALIAKPDREDLWERYRELVSRNNPLQPDGEDWAPDTIVCGLLGIDEAERWHELHAGQRAALRYYVHRKEIMDAGARMLDAERLPLHEWMTEYHATDEGPRVVACELQNEPLDDPNRIDIRLQPEHIEARCQQNYPRGIVPEWADVVIVACDVGVYRVHWEASAFSAELEAGCMIQCGIEETYINQGGAFQGAAAEIRQTMINPAIIGALGRIHAQVSGGFPRTNGQPVLPYGVVDCGGTVDEVAWYRTVIEFCSRRPQWWAMRGPGGKAWGDAALKKAVGQMWFVAALGELMVNTDHYKSQTVRAYQLPPFGEDGSPMPGARFLHRASPEHNLKAYCRQQCAESYYRERLEGKIVGQDVKSGWVKRPGVDNHWFDTAVMCSAAFDVVRRSLQAPARDNDYAPRGSSGKRGGWQIGR